MKLFYKKSNGYLCYRYPYDLQADEDDPYIEVTKEEADQTSVCELGKTWAVIDGKLQVIDHIESQNTIEYKTVTLTNQISEAQEYLTKTDYVIVKLQEIQLEDEEEYQTLKIKYADVLAERKRIRKQINEWENELANLK